MVALNLVSALKKHECTQAKRSRASFFLLSFNAQKQWPIEAQNNFESKIVQPIKAIPYE